MQPEYGNEIKDLYLVKTLRKKLLVQPIFDDKPPFFQGRRLFGSLPLCIDLHMLETELFRSYCRKNSKLNYTQERIENQLDFSFDCHRWCGGSCGALVEQALELGLGLGQLLGSC